MLSCPKSPEVSRSLLLISFSCENFVYFSENTSFSFSKFVVLVKFEHPVKIRWAINETESQYYKIYIVSSDSFFFVLSFQQWYQRKVKFLHFESLFSFPCGFQFCIINSVLLFNSTPVQISLFPKISNSFVPLVLLHSLLILVFNPFIWKSNLLFEQPQLNIFHVFHDFIDWLCWIILLFQNYFILILLSFSLWCILDQLYLFHQFIVWSASIMKMRVKLFIAIENIASDRHRF